MATGIDFSGFLIPVNKGAADIVDALTKKAAQHTPRHHNGKFAPGHGLTSTPIEEVGATSGDPVVVEKANPEGINQYTKGGAGGHESQAASHKATGLQHNQMASKLWQTGGSPVAYSAHRAAASAHYDAAAAHEYAIKFAPGAKNADPQAAKLASKASALAGDKSAVANAIKPY